MKHGSLFSGIGGFDLAAEWMGWNNVFHCEFNPFCQKILKQHFPNSKSYGDITTTDFTEWQGRVDIVTGGFPCQPYSTAGKRKGKDDDRHLWPEMLRAIREIQPTWIVEENVPGLLNWQRGMVLAEIKADMEAAGFEVFPPVILPACGKNAPHRRDRLWIVAHRNTKQREREAGGFFTEPINGSEPNVTDPVGSAAGSSGTSSGIKKNRGKDNAKSEFGREQAKLNNGCPEFLQFTSYSQYQRCKEQWDAGTFKSSPTVPSIGGRVEPGFRGGNDGFSRRVDRIKSLGNAVVPQIVFEIFKAIESIHTL